MDRIVFLSTDDLDGYVFDDELAIKPLERLGWRVDTISWRKPDVDWASYAAVIIRTTWDYHNHLTEFLKTLNHIESQTRLANPLTIVRWNAEKTYLQTLADRGAGVVRTLFAHGQVDDERLQTWFEELGSEEIVIKPTISATAQDTHRLFRSARIDHELLGVFKTRPYMVQPFMKNIVTEGEFSLFYLNGEYSHTIQKIPKRGDYRVQEEHGGLIQPATPPPELIVTSEAIIRSIEPVPLYARIDFVRDVDKFLVMELELVEPAMYLRMDSGAPERFARAIDSWLS